MNYHKKSLTEIQDILIQNLKKLYPKAIIKIKKCVKTNWAQDPYARGAYSSFGVGSTVKSVKEFSVPEGDDKRIYFAGEHTNAERLQTVLGPYLSGERVAQDILKRAKKLKN